MPGLNLLGTTFDNRLKVPYDAAMAKGLWHGYYAAANKDEYWAEGTTLGFTPPKLTLSTHAQT